jgi:hypothetical protein
MVGTDGSRDATTVPSTGEGVIRYASSRHGIGTAFVLDRRGADAVVVVTEGGTVRLTQPGEAANPSWSADGRLVWSLGSRLRVWSSTTSSTFDIQAPPDSLGVFSPVFVAPDAIVAVVAEPEPGFTRAEDEGLDNLWRYDLATRRWDRLTSFKARGDRWVALRTPVVRDDGSLEFIRVRGRGSATGTPSFELWRMASGGTASLVRALPREMYLAGALGGRRIWNLYDQASGEWRLYAERSPRELVDLGCGAALVDPRSVDDPDKTPPRSDPTPIPTGSPTPTSTSTSTSTPAPTVTPSPTPDPTGYLTGILVGDFSSVDAANGALVTIQGQFTSAPLEVVDAATAPNIVGPGVWAVVMLIPNDMDPMAALLDFRARLPEFRDWSWVVSV